MLVYQMILRFEFQCARHFALTGFVVGWYNVVPQSYKVFK